MISMYIYESYCFFLEEFYQQVTFLESRYPVFAIKCLHFLCLAIPHFIMFQLPWSQDHRIV